MTTRIQLLPARQDQKSYGLLLTSITIHDVETRHGRSYPRRVQVYENRLAWKDGVQQDYIVDAHGRKTDEEYSYILQAESIMISDSPSPRDPHGVFLNDGELVELAINDYVIGEFTVSIGPLGDEVLIPVTA